MLNNEVKTYPSAISWGIWIPVHTLIIGQGIFFYTETSAYFLVFHVLLAILIYYFIMRIKYVLSKEQLKIYMGPILYRTIEISSIRKMSLSNNPLSSPAASLKRIAIHYNQWGYVLISPKDRLAFMETVEKLKSEKSSNAG